jgi:hypothetical protein
MTYAEKLRSPEWQKKRLEILQRDKWKCQCCGNKDETLNVHHTLYVKNKNPWDYKDAVYKTLCESCHKKWHEAKLHIDVWCALIPVEELINLADICGIYESCPSIYNKKVKRFAKLLLDFVLEDESHE